METKTVWKFPVPLTSTFQLELPRGAEILHVGLGGLDPGIHVWALIDPSAPRDVTTYKLRGTGDSVAQDVGKHIATVSEGGFMWHIFEAAS